MEVTEQCLYPRRDRVKSRGIVGASFFAGEITRNRAAEQNVILKIMNEVDRSITVGPV